LRGDQISDDSKFEASNSNCALVWVWTPRSGSETGGISATCLLAYDGKLSSWWLDVSWEGGRRAQYTDAVLKTEMHDGVMAGELRFNSVNERTGALLHFALFNMPDGTVREWQESSTDGGKTWKESYDLTWRKKK
jgi:hypothetical protein